MSVGVMTIGVMSVGEITVGVMIVGVMTVGVMRRPRFNKKIVLLLDCDIKSPPQKKEIEDCRQNGKGLGCVPIVQKVWYIVIMSWSFLWSII
jgi:hypothetical protein